MYKFLPILAAATLAVAAHASAPMQPPEGPYHEVSIHGVPFLCDSVRKERVPIYFSDKVFGGQAHVSRDGTATIILNPDMLARVDARAALFVAYHECAHVALPIGVGIGSPDQETNADCFAIRQMVNYGYISSGAQFEETVSMIADLPGSMSGHLPGPERRRAMMGCVS